MGKVKIEQTKDRLQKALDNVEASYGKGSASQGVYFDSEGVPHVLDHKLEQDITSDMVFATGNATEANDGLMTKEQAKTLDTLKDVALDDESQRTFYTKEESDERHNTLKEATDANTENITEMKTKTDKEYFLEPSIASLIGGSYSTHEIYEYFYKVIVEKYKSYVIFSQVDDFDSTSGGYAPIAVAMHGQSLYLSWFAGEQFYAFYLSPNTTAQTATITILYNGVKMVSADSTDLTYYYTKSDTYNRSQVKDMISDSRASTFQFVDKLPTVGTMYTIYFVDRKDKSGASTGEYDEYIYTGSKWEMIGSNGTDGKDGSILYPSLKVDSSGYLIIDVPDEAEGTNFELDSAGYLCVDFPDLE